MIYYIIGIRRSGLHAIANWLFPMMGEYIYLNNCELGKLQENELVVNGNFNVIIGIESKPVEEVLKYCTNGKRIWVLRDKEKVILSQRKHYTDAGLSTDQVEKKVLESVHLVDGYFDYIGGKIENEFPEHEHVIYYEMWNTDEVYRRIISTELNLQFNDSNKEKIFGYGKSSFAE